MTLKTLIKTPENPKIPKKSTKNPKSRKTRKNTLKTLKALKIPLSTPKKRCDPPPSGPQDGLQELRGTRGTVSCVRPLGVEGLGV